MHYALILLFFNTNNSNFVFSIEVLRAEFLSTNNPETLTPNFVKK